MAKKIEKPVYVSPFNIVKRRDNNGFERLLEIEGEVTEEKINAEMNFRCQNVSPSNVENERTAKQLNGIYQKLFDASKQEDVIKIIFQAISFSYVWNFQPRAFVEILKTKKDLMVGPLESKVLEMAILNLNTKSAISKKLKAAYNLSSGSSEEE